MHYTYLAHGVKFVLLGNTLLALPTYYIGVRSTKTNFVQDRYATSSHSLKRGEWICVAMQLIKTYLCRKSASKAEGNLLTELHKQNLLLENLHTGQLFCTKGVKATKGRKDKISARLKCKPKSEAHKRALRLAHKGMAGKTHSLQTRILQSSKRWKQDSAWFYAEGIYAFWLANNKPKYGRLMKMLDCKKYNLACMVDKFNQGWSPKTCPIYQSWRYAGTAPSKR